MTDRCASIGRSHHPRRAGIEAKKNASSVILDAS
jgi:hypothetical protein